MPGPMLSRLDQLIAELDHGLRVLAARTTATVEPSPAAGIAESELAPAERSAAAGLMRVNHSGEVCAQALYRGQALMNRQGIEHLIRHDDTTKTFRQCSQPRRHGEGGRGRGDPSRLVSAASR